MTTIILLAPLLGALIAGFGHRIIGDKAAQIVPTAILFLCAALSWVTFFTLPQDTTHVVLLDWIRSGHLHVSWGIRLDRLTAIMLVVVTTVSALVHLYSMGYMAHDDNWKEGESYRPRFFAYLSFFTFTMLMLITGDNLVQIFFGWEGVGVASYLLIGFYYRKDSANAASMKAFTVNRVGDFGMILGMFALFMLTDSLMLDDIFAAAPVLAETKIDFLWGTWNAAELCALLLFIGAMGKSAQLVLHTWLPDAMEGPTPVSALIHAATMVTAGVFLVARMSPLMEFAPGTMTFIAVLGALTAFFAATIGLVQTDIKRVIAYSTCSQLGFMFAAAGVGVYSAALFHLLTHAFFKAMLFLGAGSVIHAMHHEQDMRNYGGLRKYIPYTFWAMMIGTLAITGVGIPLTTIGFAGFLSKDAIVESVYAGNPGLFWILIVAAFMTSFYSWRLMFLTFFGKERWGHGADHAHADAHDHGHADAHADAHAGHGHAAHGHDAHAAHGHDDHGHDHKPHESPLVMLVPLGVLALGALFSGMLWYKVFFGDEDALRDWFRMDAAQHEVADAAATGDHGAPAGAAPAGDHAEAAPAAGDDAAAAEHAALESPAVGAGDHHVTAQGTAPRGALYLAPDNTMLHDAHYVPTWVKVSPFVAMLLGLALSWLFYIRRPDLPRRLAAANAPLYRFLLNKWYFDELYHAIFVKPALWLGRFFWKKGDGAVIDAGLNGLAMGFVPRLTRAAQKLQSGYIFTYAFAMVIGIALLITWMTIGGGAE